MLNKERTRMEIVKFFFTLQHQVKLYHWQTSVYARHIASDTLGIGLAPLIDQFVEVLQGKYNRRVSLKGGNGSMNITIEQIDDVTIVDYLRKATEYLDALVSRGLVREQDTDLLNIRDEIVALINQTLYLFSFQ